MFRKPLQSKIFSIFIGLFILIVLASVLRVKLSLTLLNKEVASQQEKLEETGEAIKELEKNREYSKSEAFLEKQLRLKLNYKKPDENVVFVYRTGQSSDQTTDSNDAQEKGLRGWLKWWRNLIGRK